MEVLVLKVRFKSATWSKETKAKQNNKLGVLCWNITLSFVLFYTPPNFLPSALFQGHYLDLWKTIKVKSHILKRNNCFGILKMNDCFSRN